MDTIRAPVCLILGLALMAGCLESETGDRVEGAPPTDEKAPQSSPYAITCPGGVSRYTSPGVCAGSIFNADESLAEPYVTAHPTRPGVFALGVNSLSARPQSAGSSVGHGIGVSLYVTEDYGASWVARPLPLQIGNYRGDPSLRFDQQGILHFSALLVNYSNPAHMGNGLAVPASLFYSQSGDLGQTWTRETILDTGLVDRNWLSLAPGKILVAWAHSPGPPAALMAYSVDDGASWVRPTTSPVVEGCTPMTQIVEVKNGLFFACRQADAPRPVQVYRLETETNSIEQLAELDLGGGALLLTRHGERLALVVSAENGPFLLESEDGRTWTQPSGLVSEFRKDRGWIWQQATWAEPDLEDGLHLLVKGSQCERGQCLPDVAYIFMDSNGTSTDIMLTPLDPEPRSPEPLYRLGSADDFHGIAFGAGGGVLAWAFDRGIDYTLLQPLTLRRSPMLHAAVAA